MEEAGRENLPSQKLGIDDLVAVSVYDAPELTRTVRVEADGTIHLPMLDEGSEGRRPVRAGCGRCPGRRAQDRADFGGPGGESHGRGISQPADFSDGRGAQAAHVSSRRNGDAAGCAGAGRRAQPGCRHRSSGEPSAAVARFPRRSHLHFGGAHSAQSSAQRRRPGGQLPTARRRRNPHA